MKKIFFSLNVTADIYLVAETRAMLKKYNVDAEIDYYNHSITLMNNINWDHNNEPWQNPAVRHRDMELIPVGIRNYKLGLDMMTDVELKDEEHYRRRKEYINFFENIGEYDYYCFTSYNRFVFMHIQVIATLKRKYPNAKIIIGGPEVRVNKPTRDLFESLGCITSSKDVDIEMLERLTEKEYDWQEVRMIKRTEEDIPIYTNEDLKYLNYSIRISSSRGCWANCKFCCGPALATKDPLPRDVIAKWMREFQDRGVKEIFFNDMAINNYKFDEFLDELLKLNVNTRIPFTDVTLGLFKEDGSQMEKMAKVGFERIAAGIECFTDEMQRIMYKRHKEREVYFKLFEEMEKNKIELLLFYIFGQPGETLTTFMEDVTLLEEINQKFPWVEFEPCDYYLSPGSFVDQHREKFSITTIPLGNPFPKELPEYDKIFNEYVWDIEYPGKEHIRKKTDLLYTRVSNIHMY